MKSIGECKYDGLAGKGNITLEIKERQYDKRRSF